MTRDTTTDGRAPTVMASNGTPTGPIKRGAWGSQWAWDPVTQDFTICLRPERPPKGSGMPEPEPAHTERRCPRCRVTYPFPDTAYWQPIIKRGKPGWFSYCRPCNAERRRPAA